METELRLSNEGIDRASEMVASFLTSTGTTEHQTIAGRLAFENALLFLQSYFGEDTLVTIKVGKKLGRPCLTATAPGERFDPHAVSQFFDNDEVLMGRMVMQASGLKPHYAHRGGKNIIALMRPRPPLSSLRQILIAFVLGLMVALLGNTLLLEGQREYALNTLVMPFFNVYLGMLGGLAGPLVFLAVASGICGIGDLGTLGRNGKSLVGRFFRDNGIATVISVLICIVAFPLPAQEAAGTRDLLGDMIELAVGVLPTNVVVPFVEGNTTQIILIGAFVGIAVLVMGSACDGIRRLIGEFNILIQFLMEQLCRFIPGFIFLMIVSQVWSGTFATMLSAWYPLLMFIAIAVLFFFGRVIYTSLRFHVPLGKLLSVTRPAMMLGLTTAASSAALGAMFKGCEDLGVSDEQSSFGIPMGIVICESPTIAMLAVLMMYCMQSYGLGADVSWYVRLGLVCFLYSIVAPPVPGGLLVCFGLMFGELGIPSSALALVTALSIIMDYLLTCYRVGIIMTTVFDAGCAIGTVDRSKIEGSE
jgi:Na+/H+-dicarboxylate symporter